MATKPLNTEAIALTEKKMDMTLDEIIKMTKKPAPKERRPTRPSNKSQGFLNGIASQRNTRVQRVMDSRSSIRQGVLAQRRSTSYQTQFPLTTNVARRAAATPILYGKVNWSNSRVVAAAPVQKKAVDGGFAGKDNTVVTTKQRPQTLDALFANMKEQRMKVAQQQTARVSSRQTVQRRRAQQQQQGFRGRAIGGRRFGSSAK